MRAGSREGSRRGCGVTCSPLDAAQKPMMPIMARRPLLISATRDFSFFSADIFLVKPKGSHRSRGTGCGNASFTCVQELRQE